jgi:hypothetical protein
LIAALLELLWLAPAAFGQTASINGTVVDSTGTLVQCATVTATNIARSTETGTAGVYSLTELVAGPYELMIEKAGFRLVRFANVTLTVDQALTLNTQMEAGSIQEQITVEGTAVAVDTTDAQLRASPVSPSGSCFSNVNCG